MLSGVCGEMSVPVQRQLCSSLQIEKEEQAAAEKAVTKEEFQTEWTAPAPEFTAPPQPEVADWSEGVQVPSVPIQQFPTGQFCGRVSRVSGIWKAEISLHCD